MDEENKSFSEEAKQTSREFSTAAKETFAKENKKLLAGILAIFLGGLGIHKFVLGYNKEGIIMLVITLILGVITLGLGAGLMGLLGFIEGIIYLTKSDDDFYQTYQVNKRPWF
jgi:TM2 domain-containing membrane protein YozV